ncbi:MAG TPA: MFS transporter [Deltaproteobacteria bacterium]|nr:MFS transporter [Deltaproteobacteria bacterium]
MGSTQRFIRQLFAGTLWLFVLSHFSHHVITALIVPLLPYIRNDFALDYTQSGFVISAFSLSYGIGQLPAGWLADRMGSRNLISISIVGVALAGLMVGLSHTYILMVLCLIAMGIAGGGYHPSAPPLISASVAPENRGFALGCHVIGGSASFFLSPLIGAAIATAFGWRGAFIGLAMPSILFGIIFYKVLGKLDPSMGQARSTKDPGAKSALPKSFYRRVIPFIVLTTCTSAIMTSIFSFVPLYMVDQFKIAEKTAAAMMAIIYSTGLWAAPLGGHLSDKVGRVPMMLSICILSGPAIFLLNIIPYGHGFGFGALLLVIGVIVMIRMPVSEAFLVSEVPDRYRSTILGIYFFSAIEVGGVLTPVMGSLIDHYGFYMSFSLAGASLVLVTLISGFFLLRNGNRAF